MPIRSDDERMREAVRLVRMRAAGARKEWARGERPGPGAGWPGRARVPARDTDWRPEDGGLGLVVALVLGALVLGTLAGFGLVWVLGGL